MTKKNHTPTGPNGNKLDTGPQPTAPENVIPQSEDAQRKKAANKDEAAKEFEKPANWTNDPVPEPKKVDPEKDEPREKSPTRYGDWEKDGIAWDF